MRARRIKPQQFGDPERYDLFLLPVNETRRAADNQREVLPVAISFRKKFRFVEYPMDWRVEKRHEIFFHKTPVKPEMDRNDRRGDKSTGKRKLRKRTARRFAEHSRQVKIRNSGNYSAGRNVFARTQDDARNKIPLRVHAFDRCVHPDFTVSAFQKIDRPVYQHAAQPFLWNHHRRVPLFPHECRLKHFHEKRSRDNRRRIVEGADGNDIPQIFFILFGLMKFVEPLLDSHRLQPFVGIGVCEKKCRPDTQQRKSLKECEALQPQQANQDIGRCRKRSRVQPEGSPLRMAKRHGKFFLNCNAGESVYCREILQRGMVAAHHQMLSVVHIISRFFVDKRIRPASAVLSLLDEKNGKTGSGKAYRRRQSADAAADDNNIGITTLWKMHESGAFCFSTTPRW